MFVLIGGTVQTPRLVDTIINTGASDALAAAIVEPSVAGRTHALAAGLALVPGGAGCHVGHGAVCCHRAHRILKLVFVLA